jgi:hypothetical protein
MSEQTLNEALKEQAEYERKRGVLMNEAVLIATMIHQRLPAGPGIAPVTGDGMLLAAATIYAGWLANGEGAK